MTLEDALKWGSSCMLAAALNMIKNQAAIRIFGPNINKSYNEAIKVPPLFQQGHRINYQRSSIDLKDPAEVFSVNLQTTLKSLRSSLRNVILCSRQVFK